MTVPLIAALAVIAGWAFPAEAQSQAAQQRRLPREQMNALERRLEDKIYVRLAERAWVGSDFKATVDQGEVTLSGTVPSHATKNGILRITRRTPGVREVDSKLRVDPAVGALRSGSPVSDAELSKRVAQEIAGALDGAKAGEDWWLTGWRVEGQDGYWNMVVQAYDGAITLEGEVPRNGIVRKAVEVAVRTQGVRSVRSEVQIEPTYYSPYYGYHPYGYWGYPYAAYADPDYLVYYDATRDGGIPGGLTVTGNVTDIDQEEGQVTMETADGSIELRLPPESLKGVTEGERITVQMALASTSK